MKDRALGVDSIMWTRTSRVTGELGSEIGSVLQSLKLCGICELRSILPEATAIGVRLSHASGGRGRKIVAPHTAQ